MKEMIIGQNAVDYSKDQKSVPLSITVLSANFLNSIRIVIVSVNGLLANVISASVIPVLTYLTVFWYILFFALTLLCSLAPLGIQFYCMLHTYILYEKSDDSDILFQLS